MSAIRAPHLVMLGVALLAMGIDDSGSGRRPGGPLGASPALAQMDAGYLANVEDGKITVTYSDTGNRTEVALALVPPSPPEGSGITLVFRATFQGPTTDPARLSGITLRAHYRVMSDDRPRTAQAMTESHALRLTIDPGDPTGVTLQFFPGNWGYGGFTAPGDEIPVAWFDVTPAELRALAVARAVSGHVLWTDFSLTADQVVALRMYAREVVPSLPGAP
jgi:hypothetical protein